MANSANPEINKKIATSALGTLVIATVFFYLGDRYAETLVTYPGQIFDHLSDAFLSMWQTIKDAPFALDMTSNSLLFGGACFLIIWMIWLRYVAFIGNYRSGEESGSARWGTLKEGKKFKDLQTEDNNLLFTKNFGLALHRPKFDPEYDRNLNVLVVGGSGSGKTFNYVTPNICQLNTSYFVTDPKGTLLKDAGYLFTDNGYKLKSFNTINLDESMHYNPLKYVKTDTDILSFVNCFIMNTNPEGKSSGDPFWENAEKMLYTALIALLRDWFPAKDYNMSSLLTLLSLAEARENDENFKSALDLMFLQIEEGKKYKQNDGSSPDTAGNAGLSRSFGTKQADNGWSWVPSKFKRNSDGVKPADCGGLSADEDFALMNYKNFKVAAGKTLKSILISCNVRLAPIATDGVRELLTYDEMEIDTLGDPDAKVAIFGILSDTDKTLSFLFAILMWQTIDQLCRKALSDYGGKLPTPVHFIFDEFANIGTIPQIEETIAVTRSRNIGITIILQSMSQLESKYDKKAQTIIDCCDSTLFLGGKSNSTNKEIAEMIGKQTIHQMTYNESTGQSSSASKNLQIQGRDLIDAAEIGKMSRLKAILLIAGTNPLMDDKYDPHAHKLPKGFVTIKQLQGDLDLGDLRDEVEDFDFDGDITEAFGETAEYKVDDNYHALLTWLPDHTEWLEEAKCNGLLEGCEGDIYKMVQMAQYVYFKSDLNDHCEDICRYGTLDQLKDMGVYAIRESLADEILNDLSYDEDYAPTDDAKDTIISAIYATFEEKYGEDFADCADNFIQDNDDIAGRVNPCAMSVETVRAVYGMGFDAVFLNDWKKELAECDIDPEAVSVDSEAHDMENGRDGLDGNAPEKDAPEKDDRDAQPPVDTDNR